MFDDTILYTQLLLRTATKYFIDHVNRTNFCTHFGVVISVTVTENYRNCFDLSITPGICLLFVYLFKYKGTHVSGIKNELY